MTDDHHRRHHDPPEIPVRWRLLGPDDEVPPWGLIRDQEDDNPAGLSDEETGAFMAAQTTDDHDRWTPEDVQEVLDLGEPNPVPESFFDRLIDWTETSTCDPIADLREFAAATYLGRMLTPFERILVRAGLSEGWEFPR